jgi:hypothetical protein
MITQFNEFLTEAKENENRSWRRILNKTIKDLKLNLHFVFRFGMVVTAIMPLVNSLLQNEGFNPNKTTVVLLTLAALAVLADESKQELNKILNILQEQKLKAWVPKIIELLKDTKGLFKKLFQKAGKTVTGIWDVMSYTILSVPLINTLIELVQQNGLNYDSLGDFLKDFSPVVVGVAMFTGKNLIQQLFQKLKNKLSWKKKELQELKDLEQKITNYPAPRRYAHPYAVADELELVEESLQYLKEIC